MPGYEPRYFRKELLGKGTSAEVYRCVDSLNNTQYAMKVIKINTT
jgi:serine/threonine protein kinase